TRVSAIAELVRDGSTGLLVGENDAASLAAALADLIRDPAGRRLLGEAGEARVRSEFALEGNFARLASRFGLARSHADRLLRTASVGDARHAVGPSARRRTPGG